MKFTWTCDICDKPVADGKGYLEINQVEALGRCRASERQARLLSERYHDQPIPLDEIVSVGRERWHVHHRECDQDPESDNYWIAVERIRDLPQLLDWNAHLHEKRWLDFTDWDRFLQHRLASRVTA